MVLNPFVMLAVSDRLGADRENWRVFEPRDYLPSGAHRLSPLAYPAADMEEGRIPSMDLHPRQPRGHGSALLGHHDGPRIREQQRPHPPSW